MSWTQISIVIPCLNEAKTIVQVIKDAQKQIKLNHLPGCEIIVSDNGSTDGSLRILKRVSGIRLINVPVRGYGAALHWGILNARGKYILYADADASYPFSNLSLFITATKKQPDLVLGSRMKGRIYPGAMPFLHRYLGTPILTFLIRQLYRIPVTDCNSGMRLVRKNFYQKLNMHNSGMEWASELLLKTALKGGRYLEVPIIFNKDRRLRHPHLSSWADGWRHLKTIILLKPASLYPFLILFPLLGIVFYPTSFSLSFLFLSLFYILTLSLLTLHLMSAAIESKFLPLDNFLIHFKLVPLTGLFLFIVSGLIYYLPESRLGTKLFMVNILGITCMWIFLIETVKTHLVNRLPDSV